MTIAVPFDHGRHSLRAFWGAIGSLIAVLSVIVSFASHSVTSVLCGMGLALLTASFPFLNKNYARLAFKEWNRRVVGSFAALTKRVALRCSYFLVIHAAAKADPGLRNRFCGLDPKWVPHPARAGEVVIARRESGRGFIRWFVAYWKWAFASKNTWMIALVPVLVALRMCTHREGGTEAEVSGSIYTLY